LGPASYSAAGRLVAGASPLKNKPFRATAGGTSGSLIPVVRYQLNAKEREMANEDQAKGKVKDIGGKVKEEVGDAANKDDLKNEGQADQAEGKVQKGVGDAKEKLSD